MTLAKAQSVQDNKPKSMAVVLILPVLAIIFMNALLLMPNPALSATAHTKIVIRGGKTVIVGGRMVCRANKTAAVRIPGPIMP